MPGERQKPNPVLWEAMKARILKERQQRKLEEEQDEEVERQRREKEDKEKATALTLEETKEEIIRLEKRLSELRGEKHLLFNRLKQVLYEDETRRRQKENTANAREITTPQNTPYGGTPLHQTGNSVHGPVYGGPPPTLLVPAPQRPAIAYKSPQIPVVSQSAPSSQLPPVKRPRSPSPSPPHLSGPQVHPSFSYKPLSYQVAGVPRGPLGMEVTAPGQFYPASSAPGYPSQQRMLYTYGSGYPPMTKEEAPKSAFSSASPASREKMSPYPPPGPGHDLIRVSHASMMPSGLPVHSQQVKSGGISSGQPVRTAHGGTSYPPPSSHNVTPRAVYSSAGMPRPSPQGPRF